MTALAFAPYSSGPGVRGATKAVFSKAVKPLCFTTFIFNWGTDNYATGGEDISACWTPSSGGFTTVEWIGVSQDDTNTAADNRLVTVDYTNKKLLMYTALNTESTAADQGVVTVRLLVAGY